MGTAEDLWTEVKTSYGTPLLTSLTGGDRNGSIPDDVKGVDAAQGVLDLWEPHVQAKYDAADRQHVEVAKRGVIAMLWSRGGTGAEVARVKWDDVFGDNGLMVKLRRTGSRGRISPEKGDTYSRDIGDRARPNWSDPSRRPANSLPRSGLPDDL